MAMDWGNMYLIQSTRTVQWAQQGATGPFPYVQPPPYPVNITAVPMPPMPPMTPSGTFIFFLWYDYLGAVGMVLWAFSALHPVLSRARIHKTHQSARSVCDYIILFVIPVLFWTAPLLAPSIKIDGRVLVVSRPSPKATYAVLLSATTIGLSACLCVGDALRVFACGVACGCIHHAALFAYGMRGYSSLMTLLLTLCTEWPALILGIVSSTLLLERTPAAPGWPIVAVTIVVVAWSSVGIDLEEAIANCLPYIPGEYMHNFGTFWFRSQTCTGTAHQSSCLRPGDSSVLVLAAAAKGSA